jgi:hypothetical protein
MKLRLPNRFSRILSGIAEPFVLSWPWLRFLPGRRQPTSRGSNEWGVINPSTRASLPDGLAAKRCMRVKSIGNRCGVITVAV